MEENTNIVEAKPINAELANLIEIDKLSDNSVILFRVPEITEELYSAISGLQSMYGKQLEEKNVSFLVLKPDSDISSLNEEQMYELGWERKDKKRIITLT